MPGQAGGARWAEGVAYRFDLFDARSGATIAGYPVDRGRLFPGAQHHLAVEFPALPAGDYQLLVYADARSDQVFAARYSLTIPPNARPDASAGPAGGP